MSLLLGLSLSLCVFAQGDDVPAVVKDAFNRQYPGATGVNYEDNPLNVWVDFTLNGDKMRAHYTRKGEWKNTQKYLSFEQLPAAVQDGFRKSKFADREIEEVTQVFRSGGNEQYRLKVKKGTLQKKNLLFSTEGRLVDEDVTL